MDQIVVVGIGLGYEDQKSIITTLENNNIPCVPCERMWVRNAYIQVNGQYFTQFKYSSLGNGGLVHVFDDGIFVSSPAQANRFSVIPHRFKLNATYHVPVYFMPCPTDFSSDVDYFSLLLGNKRRVIIDKKLAQVTLNNRLFHKEISKADFDCIEYEGDSEVPYPANALVVNKEGEDIVVYDSNAKNLAKLLDELSVESIPIKLNSNNKTGRIHCITNLITKADIDILHELTIIPSYLMR
jgi:hypothetical protein